MSIKQAKCVYISKYPNCNLRFSDFMLSGILDICFVLMQTVIYVEVYNKDNNTLKVDITALLMCQFDPRFISRSFACLRDMCVPVSGVTDDHLSWCS